MSCPSCNNIGGVFDDGCYYYFHDCKNYSVGQQCHTDRYQTF